MHRITLFLIILLLIPDIYIYFIYIIGKTRNSLLRFSYWTPTILLGGTYAYFMYLTGDNALAHHPLGIGRLSIAIMLFAVPKLLFMVCSLAMLAIRAAVARRCPRWPFTVACMLPATVAFGGIAYGAFWGTTHFEVKETEYASPDIPQGFDGYRIVQVSDLHIGSWQDNPDAIDKLVELVNRQKGDVIVFTGDLVNQRSSELQGFTEKLSRLNAPDGVYSILGNHDYGSYYHWNSREEENANLSDLIRMEKDMGWRMLNNDHDVIYHNGDSIALIGVENDGEPPFSQYADLPHAMQGTEGMFRILLSHNPTHWRREVLPHTDIPLMLAGHTHAMQLILFGHSLAELKYPEWQGMYREGDRALYVNIGIGHVGLPFRFGAWPEVTVITLHKQ